MTQALYKNVIETMQSHEMYKEPCGSMIPLHSNLHVNVLPWCGCCSSALKIAVACVGDWVGEAASRGIDDILMRLRVNRDCDELVVLGVGGISIRLRILPVRRVNRLTR